jgi:DNA adenine methylase
MKPLLKWVGGKTNILQHILPLFPREIRTYHEPFVGGGAVLLAVLSDPTIHIERVRASDSNPSLIQLYKDIQSNPTRLHAEIHRVVSAYDESEDREAYYYERRARYRGLEPCVEKSALLYFLNKSCFRGLYRESKHGFNVAFGHDYNTRTVTPALGEVLEMSALLQPVEFTACDFSEALRGVAEGDFVYADPPYAKENVTSFVGYTPDGFEQDRFFSILRGCGRFLMSNSNAECVRAAFHDCHITSLRAPRKIHSKKPGTHATEVLVTCDRRGTASSSHTSPGRT